ncbi:MAG: sulfopyruvate decarboxylase subunit beta [Chloroflexi bacterium]|nr:sulfopyruvate decarboxylase subunit beta [Chloroflexota bacterium]
MDRLEATRLLVGKLSNEPVVANLGMATRDLCAAQDRDANFYMWGAMGLASSVGLGVALATPDRKVVVLDGDGSILMNLGSLATIARERPRNLVHVVCDNQQWGETGGQPTHTATGTDLASVARGAGISKVASASTLEELGKVMDRALKEDGPWCVVARIEPDTERPTINRIEPEVNLWRFRRTFE